VSQPTAQAPAGRHRGRCPGVATDVQHPLRFVVLGDSIAYGTGAGRPQDALGPRLTAALAEEGIPAELTVLAVPGAVSRDLAPQVRRAVALAPDLALVVIGANDLARFVPPAQAAADLGAAVSALRGAGAEVVVVPAPDLALVPWIPAAYRTLVSAACEQLQARQAGVVREGGGVLAALGRDLDAAFAADPRMFAADRFHPSSTGYARIAAALAPTLLAAARYRQDGSAA
jgi:lysophospholipase L1-like esterase